MARPGGFCTNRLFGTSDDWCSILVALSTKIEKGCDAALAFAENGGSKRKEAPNEGPCREAWIRLDALRARGAKPLRLDILELRFR
jgi:hypothetical protein